MSSWRLLAFVLIFDALAVLALYPRIDIFSGGYLLLSNALAVLQALVSRRLASSEEVRRLFYAKDIDKIWDKCVALLGLAELVVFFEYSHWRPLPQILTPPIQTAGLGFCAAGSAWLFWVDAYLIREFPSHYHRKALMTSGPYRYFRHPRYAGLLATRLAVPLLFGSVIASLLAILWFILIRRRAHLEEQYLSSRFGTLYVQYSAHTMGIP